MTLLARILLLVSALGLSALPVGCAAPPNPGAAAANARLPYPKAAAVGKDLDIVVTQSRAALTMNNRTPQSYRNVQVWLNQQYVAQIASLDISGDQPARLGLQEFVNARGDGYPIPNLFKPDKGYPIVLAELFDPATGLRHRLLVRKN